MEERTLRKSISAHLYIHGIVLTGVLFYQARQALTPLLLKLAPAASHTVICHPSNSLGQRLPFGLVALS